MSRSFELHDVILPQLRAATDPVVMRRVFDSYFRGEIPAQGSAARLYHVRDCRVERVKYKPGKTCMISYRLLIGENRDSETIEQAVYARIYEAGGSSWRFRRAAARAHLPARTGRAIAHLPQMEMILWFFPNDQKLPGLNLLPTPANPAVKLLKEIIALKMGVWWKVAGCRLVRVNYYPEHRCTFRLEADLQHEKTGEQQPFTAYVKSFPAGEAQGAYRQMFQLWQSPARRSGELLIAEPLAYDPHLHTVWQQGLIGEALQNHSMEADDFLLLLDQTGKSLAALHRTTLSGARRVTIEDTFQRLEKVRHLLRRTPLALAGGLEKIIDHLRASAPDLTDHPLVCLHGDLHLKNLLVLDGKIALIDLDNMAVGSPLHDLGSLLAMLVYRAVLHGIAPSQQRKMQRAVLAAYQAHTSWKIPHAQLRWFLAAGLLSERIYSCITKMKPGRLGILGDLQRRIEQLTAVKCAPCQPPGEEESL